MPMKPDDIKNSILKSIPDAEIILESLVNDGDHYKVTVISESFRDLSRVKQHQMVMNALNGKVGTELHALSIVTKTPS